MAEQHPELERLLKAETKARKRYHGLAGYPADDQLSALMALKDASEAVRKYRALHQPRGDGRTG